MKGNIIYDRALFVVRESARVSSTWPSGYGYLVDQLRRASSSVVLNMSEGLGRVATRDRERFFTIARGSARECEACIDVAHALGLVDDATHDELGRACVHVSLALRNRYGAG